MERQLFEYEALPFCKHYQVGVIPYSPLARGFLTGKYRRNGPTVKSERAREMGPYANDKGWALIDALEDIVDQGMQANQWTEREAGVVKAFTTAFEQEVRKAGYATIREFQRSCGVLEV